MANDSSNGRPLRTISFVIHATRGVIRDPVVRRKTMFVLLVIALVLLVSGGTFLQGFIHPREHPFWFIVFWLVCAWVTVTAMLLALFDLLMLRLEGRRAERRLRENLKTNPPTSTTNQ
jgi:hypothetical protein